MRNPKSFNELYGQLMERKVAFFVAFFVIMVISYAVLVVIDFIPEPIEEERQEMQDDRDVADAAPVVEAVEIVPEPAVVTSTLPLKIIFDDLDREVTILNPESRAIADLDQALLSGAVRHPDSADFTEAGNIFVLAHSSYLPNVMNKNFQAFNGIQKLTWGDTVRLHSEDTEYVYRVEKVYEAKASDVFVPETPGEARLTLATCDSFGSKDDRFMVEAVLVSSNKL